MPRIGRWSGGLQNAAVEGWRLKPTAMSEDQISEFRVQERLEGEFGALGWVQIERTRPVGVAFFWFGEMELGGGAYSSAAAPEMISVSSVVIWAWRARL